MALVSERDRETIQASVIVDAYRGPSQLLTAELKIPETQAKDVQIGQVAQVDTRNGIIPGRVSRIDPAARRAMSSSACCSRKWPA